MIIFSPAGGGPTPYHADAVHFDGATSLRTGTLGATNNAFVSVALWVKFEVLESDLVFASDPEDTYLNYMQVDSVGNITLSFSDGASTLRGATSDGPVSTGVWYSLIASGDSASGSLKLRINDADAPLGMEPFTPFTIDLNGLPFWVGDDTFGDVMVGDIADLRIMPGVSLLDGGGDIPLVTRRLFIDADGKPVDPAVATAALGAPCMLFSGNASTFGTNQGTGGAFTTTGALTNATTSPSDDPVAYHADAVHFDGATDLHTAVLSATDNGKVAWCAWLKFTAQSKVIWVIDPEGTYAGNASFVPPSTPDTRGITTGLQDVPHTADFQIGSGVAGNVPTGWFFYIEGSDTNFAEGLKKGAVYVNDTAVGVISQDSGGAFVTPYNGVPFFVGDDTFGDGMTCDIADLRIMPGVSLLDGGGDIPLATRRLFIDADGKPVNPSVATTALGAPCMLFSGDAAAFGTNQGTGGVFSTTGTLTNAATSPSD